MEAGLSNSPLGNRMPWFQACCGSLDVASASLVDQCSLVLHCIFNILNIIDWSDLDFPLLAQDFQLGAGVVLQ